MLLELSKLSWKKLKYHMGRSWDYVEGEGPTWAQHSNQTCQGTWQAFELSCLEPSRSYQQATGYNQVIPVKAMWSIKITQSIY